MLDKVFKKPLSYFYHLRLQNICKRKKNNPDKRDSPKHLTEQTAQDSFFYRTKDMHSKIIGNQTY